MSELPDRCATIGRAIQKHTGGELMNIIVIGAGGVGFWTALALSRSQRLIVFDDDTLDGTGAERLPDTRIFGRAFDKKIELLKFIAQNIEVRNEKFSHHHAQVLSANDILLDCTDLSSEERREFVEVAKSRSARYIRASYDLTARSFIVVVACGIGFSRNPARGGYTIPPTISHAMIAGGFVSDVVNRILRDEQIKLPARLEIQLGGQHD
jgi:hypothetical protein